MNDRPLRVALVYDDSLDRFGGIPQYLTVLGGALERAGHNVSLLVGETAAAEVGGCRVQSLARNVHVRFNGNRLSMPVLANRRAIRSLASAEAFDVVHVQVPYSPIMAGLLIRWLPETTALVGTFHVASERTVPRVGAQLLAVATRSTRDRFDEMICVSAHAADFARSTFGLVAPTIVGNMIELAAFRARPLCSPSKPTVVSLGALVPRKGPLQLVEAFARVQAELPEARLRIAGDGPLRGALARKTRRLGLTESVELLGAVTEHDKPDVLRSAHVACFPSRYGESFGIVLLEAMAVCGPAVLAGDNAGYRELLADVPASLSNPDAPSLARGLLGLLLDDRRRERLAAQQQLVVSRYDADAIAAEVVTVYERALARRRGAPTTLALAA